ncbi:hypothetical protein PSAB6_190138 [Paraburkholderia sabiae]|nr:hypothetical protein PSAB6_190138 [Paraburkholderia sabiae]
MAALVARSSIDLWFFQAALEMKKPLFREKQRLLAFGGESGIRTPDLRIMIPSL